MSRPRLSLNGQWEALALIPGQRHWLRVAQRSDAPPSTTGWIPAQVPGHIVADVVAAGLAPDPYVGLQSQQAEWVAQRDWIYRRSFTVPADLRKRRLFLHFEGVDDTCTVHLNGREVGANAGLNKPFDIDITDAVNLDGENLLLVAIDHAPHEPEIQAQLGSTRAVRSWKPRFAYWWDFSTRLPSTGIWDDVWLESRAEAWLSNTWTRPRLTPTGWELDVLTDIQGDPTGVEVEAELLLPRSGGGVAAAAATEGAVTLRCPNAEPWNPNGEGEQTLYQVTVRLTRNGETLDEQTLPAGFRTLEFRRTPGAPEDALPYQVVVNGKPVFIKGWNWVPVDQLYGVPRPDRYRNLIAHAKAAGCNLLRVWGGGHLERKLFYDLCDEAGILVWQEFPQSSSGQDSEPAEDQEFLDYVDEQARAMIVRRRTHPSLAIWCGGNELAIHPERRPVSEGTNKSIALLRDIVKELDPDRGWLATSPTGPHFMAEPGQPGHDVHGPWNYLGDGEQERFQEGVTPMLYSEVGAFGAADRDVFDRYLEDAAWPVDRSNPAWVHHGGWWWTDLPDVEKVFGPISGLDEYIRASQWLQAHALAYVVERQRRRESEMAGVIPWQLNEPWPNGACTNAVQFDGRAKPAFWAVANAYAPQVVSASYRSIVWRPGEEFTADAGPAAWRLVDLATGATLAEGAGAISWTVPQAPTVWALELELGPVRNQYWFSNLAEAPLAPTLRAAAGGLSVRDLDGAVELSAEYAPVLGVRLFATDGLPGPAVDAGWIPALFPGRPRTIAIDPGRSVQVTAWNAPALDLTRKEALALT